MVKGQKISMMGASLDNTNLLNIKRSVSSMPINTFKTYKNHNRNHKVHHKTFKNEKKPAELFRADLISAMKIPDSDFFTREEYIILSDSWRGEWDKGVQVPVSFLEDLCKPEIKTETLDDILISRSNISSSFLQQNIDLNIHGKSKSILNIHELFSAYYQPSELRKFNNSSSFITVYQQYNADLMDLLWLQIVNDIFLHPNLNHETASNLLKQKKATLPYLTLKLFEGIIFELEKSCYTNFKNAYMKDKENNMEFDENVICDVCRSPDSEEDNEMVFCDICNICVHQACYGILKIPKGSWICNPCKVQINQDNLYENISNILEYKCCLCPNSGGALKPTPSGTKWCHVSCALWIPEIGIGDPDKMEPITGISRIPAERWNFICAVCKGRRNGACIQCSVKSCRIAFHVTCGFKGGLDMKADWQHDDSSPKTKPISSPNTQQPNVKLKAYCPKHSRKKSNTTPPKKKELTDTAVYINSASHPTKTTSNLEESRFQRLKQMEYHFADFVDPSQEVNKILLPLPSLPFYCKDCFYPPTLPSPNSRSMPPPLLPPPAPPSLNPKNKSLQIINQSKETKTANLPQPHPSWIKRAFNFTFNYWKFKRRQHFNAPLVPSLVPLSNVNTCTSSPNLTSLLNQLGNRKISNNKPSSTSNVFLKASTSSALFRERNRPVSPFLINPLPFDLDNCYSSASLANSLFAEDCFNPINFSSLTQQQMESNLYHRLKMCVQLRQDLERVRNLSYMLIRREKLGGAYVKSRQDVWNKEMEILTKAGLNSFKENLQQIQKEDDSLYERLCRLPPKPSSFHHLNQEEKEGLKNVCSGEADDNHTSPQKAAYDKSSANFTTHVEDDQDGRHRVLPEKSRVGNARKRLKFEQLNNYITPPDLHIKRKYNNLDRLRGERHYSNLNNSRDTKLPRNELSNSVTYPNNCPLKSGDMPSLPETSFTPTNKVIQNRKKFLQNSVNHVGRRNNDNVSSTSPKIKKHFKRMNDNFVNTKNVFCNLYNSPPPLKATTNRLNLKNGYY